MKKNLFNSIKKELDKSEYRIDAIGTTEAKILIGGSETTVGDKVVPNQNISWECFSGSEKYFLNVNRRDVTVTNEKETFNKDELSIKVGGNTDIWKIVDGKLKWNIKLDKKPASNVFEWDLEFSKGIAFHYQDSIVNEFAAGKYPMFTTLEECLESVTRPENVEGSYAIYCDKKHDFQDVKYRTGKLGHIYRPWVADNTGKRVWADLKIDEINKILRITIPQDFLDSAVFPVIIDPTFGQNDEGASDFNHITITFGWPETTSGQAGAISTIHAYVLNDSASEKTSRATIYTDDSGNSCPETHFGNGPRTLTVAGSLNGEVSASMTGTLVDATKYWFGWRGDNDFVGIDYDTVSGSLHYNNVTDMADTTDWHSGSSGSFQISVWVTYAAAGGSPLSPSITESMTIAESITVGPLDLAGITVTESMTISESISMDLPLATAIEESITILESLGEDIPLSQVIAQSITLGELITAIKDLADISLAESTVIGEYLDASLEAINVVTPSLSDSVTIAELITLNIPIALSITESMAIQEAITGLLDILSTVTEVMTIDELITATLSGVGLAKNRGLLLRGVGQ